MKKDKFLKTIALLIALIQVIGFAGYTRVSKATEEGKTTITFHFQNTKDESWALWV